MVEYQLNITQLYVVGNLYEFIYDLVVFVVVLIRTYKLVLWFSLYEPVEYKIIRIHVYDVVLYEVV
jgi:hypothetical protein